MEEKEKIYFIRLDCGADKNLMVAALEKMGGTMGHFERMKLDELKPDDKTHYDCLALFAGESPDNKHILLGNTETLRESGNYDAKELLFYPYYEEFHDEDWEILVEKSTLPPVERGDEKKMTFKFSSLSATNDAYKMFAYATNNDVRGIVIEDDTISISSFAFNIVGLHDTHSTYISLKLLKQYRIDYDYAKKQAEWYACRETPFTHRRKPIETPDSEGKSYLQWEDDAVKIINNEEAKKIQQKIEEAASQTPEETPELFKGTIQGNEEMTLNKEGYYNIAEGFDVQTNEGVLDIHWIRLVKRWTLKDAKPGDIIIFENNTVVGNKKIYVVFKSYNEFADSNNKGNIESEMWAYGFINYDDTLHAEEISYDSSYIKSMKHRLATKLEVFEFESMLREQYRKRWNKELLKFEDIIPEWLQNGEWLPEGEQPRYFTVKFDATRRNGPFYIEIVDFTNSEEDITRIEQGLVFKSTYEAEPYVTAQNEAYKKINEEYLKK